MTPAAYYNEYEPSAAAWLRELIARNIIAPGDVDTRSIEDVRPDDLRGYTQCHFFAGIGVWSYALRRAGWPDDRPIWTGSCPCQPFSTAGKGLAFADERHLWPAFYHLIKERRPTVILGEQVASKDVDAWIDLVHADMEALGHAFGSIPFPAAGVGAPHIRDRNYWVAHASGRGLSQRKRNGRIQREALGAPARQASDGRGAAGGLADANGWHPSAERQQCGGEQRQQSENGGALWLADTYGGAGGQGSALNSGRDQRSDAQPWSGLGGGVLPDGGEPGPTNGFWRDADWIGCTDGKWRPVEPGTFPLADGAAARVGRLRGYGNAINAESAIAWIEVVMDTLGIDRLLRAADGSLSSTMVAE